MPLGSLRPQPNDPLLKIIGMFAADIRTDKIDLGVGVFRTEDGATPVMAAVKQAEEILWHQQISKAYLGPEGDKDFVSLLGNLVLGDAVPTERRFGLQTPGGTGALRLAAELLTYAGVKRIWIATPSWANHAPLLKAGGLKVETITAYSALTQSFDHDGFASALSAATRGDAILLHGCCHNPMGIDPTPDQWDAIADIIAAKGLIPLVDLAYQGLGNGFDADAAGAQSILRRVPYGLLAYSCDKNFALYRERVGALWVTAPDQESASSAGSNLLALARVNWSMPPDHGAAIVRIILQSPELTALWRAELDDMRDRLNSLRQIISAYGRIGTVDLSPIAKGKGMFATLPLSPMQIDWLREEWAIYMAGSGRINIAGLTEKSADRLAVALRALAQIEGDMPAPLAGQSI